MPLNSRLVVLAFVVTLTPQLVWADTAGRLLQLVSIPGLSGYEAQVREYTTTDLKPAEIHALGLREVARIGEAMRKEMVASGWKGSFDDFLIVWAKVLHFQPSSALLVEHVKSHAMRRRRRIHLDGDGNQPERNRTRTRGSRCHDFG